MVNKTLSEICGDNPKPVILVFNKVDAFTYTPKDADDLTEATAANRSLEDLKQTWMAKMAPDCVFISAKERENIDELKKLIYDKARKVHAERFPYNDFLYEKYESTEEEPE